MGWIEEEGKGWKERKWRPFAPARSAPTHTLFLTFQAAVQGVKRGLHKVGQVVLLLEDGDLLLLCVCFAKEWW
jgi:hypothetical protein